MRQMSIVREQEETRRKSLESEIDSAKRRLYDIMKFNAVTEKKLFFIW